MKPPLCVASQHPVTEKKGEINREVVGNEEQMSCECVSTVNSGCNFPSECVIVSESDSQSLCYCNSIIPMSYELRVAEGLTYTPPPPLLRHSDCKPQFKSIHRTSTFMKKNVVWIKWIKLNKIQNQMQ